jgi:hypothetical protein
MWHSGLGAISIGEQAGEPDDGGLGCLKVSLYQWLLRYCRRTYCPSVDHFALVLRVSGSLDQFGREGIERIRRNRKQRYIGADIIVPEQEWRSRTEKQLKVYLADQVRQALRLCVLRIQKDGDDLDERRLLGQVDKAIAKFLQAPIQKEREQPDVKRWLARAKAALKRKRPPNRESRSRS